MLERELQVGELLVLRRESLPQDLRVALGGARGGDARLRRGGDGALRAARSLRLARGQALLLLVVLGFHVQQVPPQPLELFFLLLRLELLSLQIPSRQLGVLRGDA